MSSAIKRPPRSVAASKMEHSDENESKISRQSTADLDAECNVEKEAYEVESAQASKVNLSDFLAEDAKLCEKIRDAISGDHVEVNDIIF